MRPYPSAGIVGAIERAGFLIQGIGFLLEAREIDCLRRGSIDFLIYNE